MEHTKTYQEFKKNGNTKFVRYSEGAEMYHMSVSKFMQMAKDAKAIYKLGQLVLVNLKIFDEYIETFHIVDDEFYKQVKRMVTQLQPDVRAYPQKAKRGDSASDNSEGRRETHFVARL